MAYFSSLLNQHVFTGRGQRHLVAIAVGQRQTNVTFQRFDLHRHGRWREVLHLGSTGKNRVPDGLGENPDFTEDGAID